MTNIILLEYPILAGIRRNDLHFGVSALTSLLHVQGLGVQLT